MRLALFLLLLALRAFAAPVGCEYPFQQLHPSPIAIPADQAKAVKKVPAYLLDPALPSHPLLVKLAKKNPSVRLPARTDDAKLLTREGYDTVLKLMESMGPDGNYLFVGNGMQPFYQMAMTLFVGTPVQSRIKFLPLSRSLIDAPYNTDRYFDGLLKDMPPGRIFVIDTIAPKNAYWGGRQHGVFMLRDQLAAILARQGDPSAHQRVVPVGLREVAGHQTYNGTRVKDIAEYAQAPAVLQPGNNYYIDPHLSVRHVLDPYWSAPRWNLGQTAQDYRVKFSALDADGRPRTPVDALAQSFARYPDKTTEQVVAGRKKYVDYYTKLVAVGLKYRENKDVRNRINALAKPLTRPSR